MVVLPCDWDQIPMRNASHWPMGQTLYDELCSRFLQCTTQHTPSQGRQHFSVDQLRGNKRGVLESVSQRKAEWGLQEILDRNRCVDYVSSHSVSNSR